jgi:hypothetical protein
MPEKVRISYGSLATNSLLGRERTDGARSFGPVGRTGALRWVRSYRPETAPWTQLSARDTDGARIP